MTVTTRITRQYLERKTKSDLAQMYLDLLDDSVAEPTIRCRDCGSTLMYEKIGGGYEVIHSCHAGKQVREMVEHAKQPAPKET
jgi:hypothetical protein